MCSHASHEAITKHKYGKRKDAKEKEMCLTDTERKGGGGE